MPLKRLAFPVTPLVFVNALPPCVNDTSKAVAVSPVAMTYRICPELNPVGAFENATLLPALRPWFVGLVDHVAELFGIDAAIELLSPMIVMADRLAAPTNGDVSEHSELE